MRLNSNRGLSKVILTSILVTAGIVTTSGDANAEDTMASMDSQTAEQILRVLIPNDQQLPLDRILQADSINDLTQAEQEQLLQASKIAAKNLTNSLKPVF
jgi:alkylated DNA nucleotide flippase Atl1